ncbi:MAG: hypothetical protein ACM32I_09970 [Nitrospirota bacterium]|jgi:hypothetical protein
MDRREFLIGLGIALVAGPAAISLNSCGSSSSSGSPTPANGFSVQSSVTNNHTHNVTILFADLQAQPTGGVTYTSDGATHFHKIQLTQQQLADINNGGTDSVTSIPDNTGHSHEWTIKKPA